MKFKVSIDFRRGEQFSCEVIAPSAEVAKLMAIRNAVYMGMDYSVKRVVVRAVEDVAA